MVVGMGGGAEEKEEAMNASSRRLIGDEYNRRRFEGSSRLMRVNRGVFGTNHLRNPVPCLIFLFLEHQQFWHV